MAPLPPWALRNAGATRSPFPSRKRVWPMPVEEFQFGHYPRAGRYHPLDAAGVLLLLPHEALRRQPLRPCRADLRHAAPLCRRRPLLPDRGDLQRRRPRRLLRNHRADQGLQDTREKPRYVVGIKRLETDWFTPEMRPMVSGRMLRFIKDDDYNFALLAALATNRSSFFFRLRDSLFGRAPTIADFLERGEEIRACGFHLLRLCAIRLCRYGPHGPGIGLCSPHRTPSRPATTCSSRPGSSRNARWKC